MSASPVAGQAERDIGIARTKRRELSEGFLAGAPERFQEGFSRGFGAGAPLGGGPLDIATQPVRAALAGTRGLIQGAQNVLPRDIAAAPEAFAGSATGMLGHVAPGAPSQVSEALFPGASGAAKATTADRARALVEKTLAKSIKGGETSALGIMDKIADARQNQQPLTLSDIGGVPIRRLAGTVYRSGGEAASHMKQFYEGRGTALEPDQLRTVGGARLEKAINDNVATGSYKAATNALIAQRSEEARPLWDAAMSHAPVWSERLQEFLADPEWQQGIRRGLRMERRDARAEGRPFRPSDYAIVDFNEAGDPVLGPVPTMKLLQVAREGRAAQIDDHRDQLTGGLDKEGRSLWRDLKAFEKEGYKLNPEWKAANDAWSGSSDSIRALQLGKKIYQMPLEDLRDEFNGMSASDKELFRLGAADTAVDKLRHAPKEADPAKRVGNTTDERMRLNMLFDKPQDFQRMMGQIERERLMFETPGQVMKGSQTAERIASDLGTGVDLAHGASHALTGNLHSALAPLLRASRGLGLFDNPKLNLEVAKILTDPSLTIADMPEIQRWATQILGKRMAPPRGGLRVGEVPKEFLSQ